MGAALLELDIRLAEGSLLPFLSERDTTSFLIYRGLSLNYLYHSTSSRTKNNQQEPAFPCYMQLYTNARPPVGSGSI